PRLGTEAASGLVEPRPDGRPPGTRRRLAGQEQEGGLEHVVGVGGPRPAPGGPTDEGTVPADQFGERRFVAGRGERGQQCGVAAERQAEVGRPKGGEPWGGRHGRLPTGGRFTRIMPVRPGWGPRNQPPGVPGNTVARRGPAGYS